MIGRHLCDPQRRRTDCDKTATAERLRAHRDVPHLIYEFDEPGGHVAISSPQFPRLAFTPKSETPTMLELATLNEHVEADYLHRYNHLQHRCETANPDDAVYLIRWLSSFHKAPTPLERSRGWTATSLVLAAPLWRSGRAEGPRCPLSTGEYLVGVVAPDDTVGFLFDQISHTEPVTFFPLLDHDGVRPLAISLDDDPAGGPWHGRIDLKDLSREMS